MRPQTMAARLIRQEDESIMPADAVLTIQISTSVDVTEHPIEDGSVVSDHAVRKPRSFTLEIVVTESPGARAETSGLVRLQQAWDWLNDSVGKFIDIATLRLGTFTNCMITRYPTEIALVRELKFSVELKEVQIATSTTVVITVEATATGDATNAADEVDTGEQGTDFLLSAAEAGDTAAAETTTSDTGTTETDPSAEEDQSALAALLDATE